MEGKERFGTKYEENSIRSDCRLRIQGMSDLFGHECVDISWDDFFLDDDRIVPHHGSKRLTDNFNGEENNKKCRRGSATKYVDHRKEKSEILPLSKTKNTMLEKDPLSLKPSAPFNSGSDKELIKEASGLVHDGTMPLPHGLKGNNGDLHSSGLLKQDSTLNNKTSLVDDVPFNFPIGEVNHTDHDLGFFEQGQNKDSNDLLYYGWSEIENFDDIDRMFRSDSSLGLRVSKEDEMSWLSSDDTGGPVDVLRSDAKYPCPDPSGVKTISENHDFLNGCSPSNFSMANARIRDKDCSWSSEKSDSYRSFLTGPDIEDSKYGFLPPEQGIGSSAEPKISTSSQFRSGSAALISEHKKQIDLPRSSEGKSKLHCRENGSFAQISDLQNEIIKCHSGLTSSKGFASVHVQNQQQTQASDSDSCLENPISSIHLNERHSYVPSSVNLEQSNVKSETNDLAYSSSRDSHHVSSQLQCMGGFPGPPFKETALVECEWREQLESSRGNISSGHDSLKNGSVAVLASNSDDLVGKHENYYDRQGISSATAAEVGSTNMQERSTTAPDLADISLEAASFRQLQLVAKQLDLRTKLCIRDSLYRLAQSAEQRQRNRNLNGSFGDERDAAGGASEAEVANSFMDMETATNHIDRSVAHLLFHRHPDSSTTLARDSFTFKSPSEVHGPVASPPILFDSLIGEEKVSVV